MGKKLSRREFLRLSALTAGGAALAACKSKAEPTAAPSTDASDAPSIAGSKLSMKLRSSFIPQVNEVLKALILDWGVQNNVEVEVDIVGMNDLQTIAATAAETGAGPDIIELNQASAHLFAEALADVTDVANDLGSRHGGWYDSAIEACKVGEQWLALPRYYASHAINYRKDIFDQIGAGIPETWEDLYQIGLQIKAAGLPPIAFPLGHAVGDGNDFNYSVLWSYGGSDVDKDGKTVTIDSDGTRAALAFMKKFFDDVMPPDTLSYDDGSNNRAFNAGEISVTNNAASIYINARNQNIMVGEEMLANLMDHFPYPSGPAGTVTYAEFMSQAIFKYSKNIPAAKALLTYINEKDQLSPYAMPANSFVFPCLKDYRDMAIMPWNSNPVLSAFKGYAEKSHIPGYPSTNFRGGTEAYARWIVVDLFASVCSGAATIDEAIAAAEEQLKAIYG